MLFSFPSPLTVETLLVQQTVHLTLLSLTIHYFPKASRALHTIQALLDLLSPVASSAWGCLRPYGKHSWWGVGRDT